MRKYIEKREIKDEVGTVWLGTCIYVYVSLIFKYNFHKLLHIYEKNVIH